MVHLFFVGGGIKHRDLLLGFPLLYHYLPGCEESLQKNSGHCCLRLLDEILFG